MVGRNCQTYGRCVENWNDFHHVGEQNIVEEFGVALFQTVEKYILFETLRLAAKLDKASLYMVSFSETRRHLGWEAKRDMGGVLDSNRHDMRKEIITKGSESHST